MLLNDWTNRVNAIPVKNTTTETIPAGAVMIVNGAPDKFGRLPVAKPTADNQLGVIVNGPHPILGSDSKDGPPYGWGSFDALLPVSYQKGNSLPEIRSEWGPQEGEWRLKQGNTGFIYQSSANDTDQIGVFSRVGGSGGMVDCYVRRPAVTSITCTKDGLTYTTRNFLIPISGVVVASVTKDDPAVPVQGVLVEIVSQDHGDPTQTIVTGSDGKATIRLPEGEYLFTPYAQSGYTSDPVSMTVVVGAADKCENIANYNADFFMVPE